MFNRIMFYISAPAWIPAILIAWTIMRLLRYDIPFDEYYRWFKGVMGVNQ